jgi:hypothetical protein
LGNTCVVVENDGTAQGSRAYEVAPGYLSNFVGASDWLYGFDVRANTAAGAFSATGLDATGVGIGLRTRATNPVTSAAIHDPHAIYWTGSVGGAIFPNMAVGYTNVMTIDSTGSAKVRFSAADNFAAGTVGSGIVFDYSAIYGAGHNRTITATDADGAMTLYTGSPANNDCAKFSVSGGITTLITSGSGCGGTGMLSSVAFGGLGTPGNGQQYYCTDCTVTSGINNTCAGSGSGALATRINGAWKCVI